MTEKDTDDDTPVCTINGCNREAVAEFFGPDADRDEGEFRCTPCLRVDVWQE